MKSYYGGPIETQQRSFKRCHPRTPTASPSPRLWVRKSNPKLQSQCIISGTGKALKLRTANLVGVPQLSCNTCIYFSFLMSAVSTVHRSDSWFVNVIGNLNSYCDDCFSNRLRVPLKDAWARNTSAWSDASISSMRAHAVRLFVQPIEYSYIDNRLIVAALLLIV